VSTSNNPGRLEPRATMSLIEIGIAAPLLIVALLIGPIGAWNDLWSAKTAALSGAGGAIGGLILWAIIHHILVDGGIIRPIDPTLNYQVSSKPGGSR
jgi:hypothetical protein